MRVNLLFFAPLPLLIRAFGLGAGGLVLTLAGFGLLLLAAWLTREGELAQEAYEAPQGRPPAGVSAQAGRRCDDRASASSLACAARRGGPGRAAVCWALLGAVLHVLSFGPDPMRDKGMEGIDTYAQDRAARAVDGAETYLEAMKDAILRARDRTLEARVDRFQATARAMFRQVEEDPRDLIAAKKYLTVYLMGARDATVKFADLYAQSREPKVRADYEALLDDLEASFAARTAALLDDNRDDLDVEIEVLRERLEREGVTLTRETGA